MDMIKKLIDICEPLGATIMRFEILGIDKATAIIEDSEGRLSTVYYYENKGWM